MQYECFKTEKIMQIHTNNMDKALFKWFTILAPYYKGERMRIGQIWMIKVQSLFTQKNGWIDSN